MANRSRYSKYASGRVPHRKHSILVHGAKEDHGKYYRCWYCGFINNVDRNAIGNGDGTNNYLEGDGAFDSGAFDSGAFDATGTTVVSVNVVSGCSVCGSMNFR